MQAGSVGETLPNKTSGGMRIRMLKATGNDRAGIKGSAHEKFPQIYKNVLEDISQLWPFATPKRTSPRLHLPRANLVLPAVYLSSLLHTATSERPQKAVKKCKRICSKKEESNNLISPIKLSPSKSIYWLLPILTLPWTRHLNAPPSK